MAMAFSSGLSSDLAGGADTIIARATPAGSGALAVIRVSGPGAAAVASRVCPQVDMGRPWRAALSVLCDAAGEELDRAVVIPYAGPRSATGEDMFEAIVHGSQALVELVIEAGVAAGARRAEPGEFTRRAVANGKLDLVQAEAIRDLVNAETAWQLRNAREQLAGALSGRLQGLRNDLVALLALMEGALDFEAQGVAVSEPELEILHGRCLVELEELLETAEAGRAIRDGVRVSILGAPNAGKSTLFNTLCGSERAIVSDEPGTTRDVLEQHVEISGLQVLLQDTAGLRAGGGAVEAEGHRRALAAAQEADLVLLLWSVDAAGPAPEPAAGPATIRISSRADLGDVRRPGWLRVSCRSGEGVDELRRSLRLRIASDVADLGGAVAIGARHRAALQAARAELSTLGLGLPELAAERVRSALLAVEELVGSVGSEEVLDRVFATFCVGK